MKIAYLISVHKDPSQLWGIVEVLHDSDSYFFIHLDAQVDKAKFTLPRFVNECYIPKRHGVDLAKSIK